MSEDADEQTHLILQMLQQLMTTQGLTQKALGETLAAVTGEPWPQQRVWKLLHDKLELTVEMLVHVCQALHISLVDLLVQAQALRPMPPEVRRYLETLSGGLVTKPIYIVLAP